jgi:hypothetical protein
MPVTQAADNSHTACRTALCLPEILHKVLQQLHGGDDNDDDDDDVDDINDIFDFRDGRVPLVAAIRVSRLWFAVGTDILWQRPAPDALCCVAEQPRRRLYAAKICVFGARHYMASAELLHMPRLRSLSIERAALGAERFAAWLQQYVHGGLEELGCTFTAAVFDCLAKQQQQPPLRQLRRLQLFGDADTGAGADAAVDADAFGRFVDWLVEHRPFPALEAAVMCGSYVASTRTLDSLLAFFAHCDKLEQLRVENLPSGVQVTSAALAKVRATAAAAAESDHHIGGPLLSQPFAQLRDLAVAVTLSAAPELISMLPSITKLQLDLSSSSSSSSGGGADDINGSGLTTQTSVLAAASALGAQLRSLHVEFGADARVSRADLLAIRRLTQLENLVLRGGSAAADVADAHCAWLFLALAKLRTLTFLLRMPSGALQLTGEARWCSKRLQRLELAGAQYIRLPPGHSYKDVLYPELEELAVESWATPPGIDEG